jgi:hypothetical protein
VHPGEAAGENSMNKLYGGLVLGILAGGVAGAFLFGPMVGVKSASPAGRPAAASTEAGAAGNAAGDSEANAARKDNDKLRAELDELHRKLAAAELDANMNQKRVADENTTVKADNAALRALMPTAAPVLPPEEVARRRTLALDLSKLVREKIAANDKAGVLAALADIRALGKSAYPEYLAILAEVQLAANAGSRGGNNSLGIGRRDMADLLTPEMRNYVLENPVGGAPPAVMQSVVGGLVRDTSRTREEKDALLVNILQSATDKDVLRTAADAYDSVDPARAAPMMREMALNGNLDPDVRITAVETFPDEPDPETANVIKALRNDPDPRVAEAAKIADFKGNPPTSGYLVDQLSPDGLAKTSGFLLGDIILRFGASAVTDNNLSQFQSALPETGNGQVVVYRNGKEVTLHIPRGRLGLDGGYVKKK